MTISFIAGRYFVAVTASAACLAGAAVPAAWAQSGRWGGSGWGGSGRGGSGWNSPYEGSMLDRPSRSTSRRDPREGRVAVSRFLADGPAADLLGRGPVQVSSLAGTTQPGLPDDRAPGSGPLDSPALDSPLDDYLPQNARAPYEAAVVDRLVALGYDTIHADPAGGQLAELRVSRDVLVPAEIKRSPVSGTAAMEVGTRGSAYGLAVNVDMTKPRTALVSTRLDARIRDRVSGKVLWEGRAEIATREGDDKWTDGMIASKLAEALFDDFRHPTGQGSPRG